MSVIVKGVFEKEMPMPQEGYVDIRLHFKGGRIECATMPIGNPPYYATFKVAELPPHGRLGDLDKLMTEFMDSDLDHLQRDDWREIIQIVADAPTVIEGSET